MLENIWPSILVCMPTPSQHNWDIWGGRGGEGGGAGEQGVRVSRFPYHVLSPPVLLCHFASQLLPFIVLLPSSSYSRGSETRVNVN